MGQCGSSHSHDLRASSSHLPQGGHLSLTHSTVCQMKVGARSLMGIGSTRSPVPPSMRSALRCCPGEVKGPLSQVLQDQLLHSHDPGTSFSHRQLVVRGEGQEAKRISLPCPHHCIADCGTSSPTLTYSGSAPRHLCQRVQLYCAALGRCRTLSPE